MRSIQDRAKSKTQLDFSYPFAAIVGMPLTKRALLLLAVDTLLKGVVISAASGTAKSAIGRSVRELFQTFDGVSEIPFVEIPSNVTRERLFGGLDIEYAFSTGKSRIDRGLIEHANNGILYIDDISLLGPGLTNELLSAIDQGRYQIEREGISASVKSDFVVVAGFNHDEKELNNGLLDRIGLIVSEPDALNCEERTELLNRHDQFVRNPESFARRFHKETTRLSNLVKEARRRLSTVTISNDNRRRLSATALNFGIEGNRAEIFAVRVARANAALTNRSMVTNEDLKVAIQLVFVPRALTLPDATSRRDNSEQNRTDDQRREETPPDQNSKQEPGEPVSPLAIDDLVLEALSSDLPDDLQEFWSSTKKESGRSVARQTSRARNRNATREAVEKRGRHINSTASAKNKSSVDLFATLITAAPHQNARRLRGPNDNRVLIDKRDLRFKQFKQKIGSLFIFVVDASGSMTLNRINQAKGALISLLQKSYLNRDRVALITFRKDGAEILLSPSRSVALAKRAIDSLPVGGATPLAAGLLAAIDMATRARRSGVARTPVVLFTDGRANIGLNGMRQDVQKQIEQLANEIRRLEIPTIVVDTQLKFTSAGDGERLANLLGGRYSYLPRADAKSILKEIGFGSSTDIQSAPFPGTRG